IPQGQQSQDRLGRHRKGAERGPRQCAGHDVALRHPREAGDARGAGPEIARRDSDRRHRDRARQENPGRRDAAAIGKPMTASPTDRPTGTVDPKLLEILVCPLTKSMLEYDAEKQELISRAAKLAYPIRDGIPIMLPEE